MNKKALRLKDYLQHMSDAIDRVQRYMCGKSKADFIGDEQLQDAVVRNIEIIGEAAKNISQHAPDFSNKNPQIPWPALYAMRNRLSHGYWTIDLDIVWQVVHRDLHELKQKLEQLELPD
ncbi:MULTISPECIES: DUF86 domain-containing protein [unclassified Ectothiorhodospira]|uniref:HepT-like ribonuclease domain-containing protein n=1 Tax=unclassified Ectothiorhodospira TaxID=2684909 RepID=UPI001EE97BBB|nr:MULTISPECIES: DUF86 domain-containing protein [unclassified Ectothiorhodospira]MCG5516952.1 DUF86 domain-containing protein [Ectothiorhodospira sp. 9100]MCG5519870.1 DUF86 domain-containing protein [Ectothiorhodospira sp. 9905]